MKNSLVIENLYDGWDNEEYQGVIDADFKEVEKRKIRDRRKENLFKKFNCLVNQIKNV